MTRPGEARQFLETSLLADTDDCILWPFNVVGHGYGQIKIQNKPYSVPRLVCERFHGPCPPGGIAAHGPCNNRLCFNPRHLSWGTYQSNQDDRVRDETVCRGEAHPMAKLSQRDVREIRQQYATGEWLQRQLADEFGVTRTQIGRILKNRVWRSM
jgi:HNH endonuclease